MKMMIYPNNFERKIGFSDIRGLLAANCMCSLGTQMVEGMHFSVSRDEIDTWLCQVKEFRRLMEENDDFPLAYFFDMREEISRLRLEGTHLEEEELWNLKRSLETIHNIIIFLCRDGEEAADGSMTYKYPTLQRLTEDICIFPNIIRRIGQIVDKYGHIKDWASPELGKIRQELQRMEGKISGILRGILTSAQTEGLIEKDVQPTLRDGRLVIPVAPAMKRKIRGIVHDESASGKTVFIEPSEVVEANNRIRELEAEERREVIRILKEIASQIRPYIKEIADSYQLLAQIDFIRAKALLANKIRAFEPAVSEEPVIDWIQARHPLLQLSIEKSESERIPEDNSPHKAIVPLDIRLTKEGKILVISGPNAGGKSVCLKTTGLLQYMVQCGLSIPVGDRSSVGVFTTIMIDIGDEQSISDDLSTYSSHLQNMKQMIRNSNDSTLILIDEFGTGTEPQIGGAIAESVLNRLRTNGAWGIITTHYKNLKEFADKHEGVINGAMLYDRHEMRPLFQLAIGRPGSSFAVEIARKIGLPEDVIREASELVGQDYVQSDKYLQDIVRDKRYWEGKRQTIHQQEKDMEKTIMQYRAEIERLENERKAILSRAKAEAKELLAESNRKIELAIKEIRESQAEKEETKRIREELNAFSQEVDEIDVKQKDADIARKIEQIQQRQQRREERKRNKMQGLVDEANKKAAEALREAAQRVNINRPIEKGDTVRIHGTKSVGTVEALQGKIATVVFGTGMRSKVKVDRLEHATMPHEGTAEAANTDTTGLSATAAALKNDAVRVSRMTRETMDDRQKNFRHDLDVRGMRGDEAINAVQYFIDDAILVGVQQVRILHGKGNGILRQLIRQYLHTVPNVINYHDEDIRFGGAGRTVAEF